MAEQETHNFRYFVYGALAGLVGGILLAPKPGSEMREDLLDYTERGRGIARRFIDRLPFRAKAAGVKGMASEAYEEARENV